MVTILQSIHASYDFSAYKESVLLSPFQLLIVCGGESDAVKRVIHNTKKTMKYQRDSGTHHFDLQKCIRHHHLHKYLHRPCCNFRQALWEFSLHGLCSIFTHLAFRV